MYRGGLDSNVDKNHSRSQINFHTVFNVTYTLFGPLLNLHPSRRLLSVESSVPPQREADRPAGVLEHRDGLVLPRAAEVDVVHPKDLVPSHQGARNPCSNLKLNLQSTDLYDPGGE